MRNGVSVGGMRFPSGTDTDCGTPGELGNRRFRAVEEEEGIERSVVGYSDSPRRRGTRKDRERERRLCSL